ncbi:MAG: amidohydrolase family protein [Ignavibacteria bacterium]
MDKYIVIKNGLVLTLDRKSRSGFFNIIIRNNKIFLIDYERQFNQKEFAAKNPDALIIDAENKLVMPGFFNASSNSSYSLNKIFFRKCSYENLNSWLSLKLIDNYLSGNENSDLLIDLLKISYSRSVLNGELFVNESSPSIKKDFFDKYLSDPAWIHQYYNLTAYDHTITDIDYNFVSLGFRIEDDLNNYALSSVKKNLSHLNSRLIVEASLSRKSIDSIRNDFGRPFINVLAEMELISGNTIISNPNHLNPGEMEILEKKRSSVLISPSDYINLSVDKIDLNEIVSSQINIMIGTGYTGIDILSELKTLSALISKDTASYVNILQMAILNPATAFGISNLTGSIERNKSADMIFFDLNDLRNFPAFPEPDSENISEFIIKNLSTKDISDVMLKGEVMVKDKKKSYAYIDDAGLKSKDISEKIFAAGKYFEFKEKYLMRGRVDKMGLNAIDDEDTEPVKEEIFVDMTETGEYVGEGEFTILGTKEDEFEKPRQKEESKPAINLKEIKSLESDLNLFDEEEEIQEVIQPDIKGISPEQKTHRSAADDVESSGETSETGIEIKYEEKEDIIIIENENKNPEFKKVKLKFGFKDGEQEN